MLLGVRSRTMAGGWSRASNDACKGGEAVRSRSVEAEDGRGRMCELAVYRVV